MITGVISWVIFGLVIGALAKLVMPGTQGGGWLITIVLGIVGSMIGGFVAGNVLGLGGSMWSFTHIIISVLGAVLVIFLYGMLTKGRN